MSSNDAFTDEQTNYLQGFAAGSGLSQSLKSPPGLPTFAATLGLPAQPRPHGAGEEAPLGPDAIHRAAQDRAGAGAGGKLCAEEQAKRTLNGLDTWDLVLAHARDGRFPRGTDVFLMKFQGMFYVAPAQDAFMCRLRFPGGLTSSHQLRGVADLAQQFGGGYADVTTRANLQIREIGPKHTADVLMGLADLGIVNRGAGADNIRNITASPTAGIDPHELIDTRPLARQMHHHILHHREMYGLPRKFNIAFDGGGSISALEDTNDIGFAAVRVGPEHQAPPPAPGTEPSGSAAGSLIAGSPAKSDIEPGIYFRMQLGGITGHKDFARDTGVLLHPEECVEIAAAAVRVFIEHGDRTDRKKARLKYLLDRWGFEKFLDETEKVLGRKLTRYPIEKCHRPAATDRTAHVGFHPQKQPGLAYAGVVLPVGRMRAEQMRGLAAIADRYGSGSIRLTVWQNLLIADLPQERIDGVKREIEALGLGTSATGIRAGLVACTGNAGCKYAAANTKAHALQVADYLDSRLALDQPINLHLTGCHHSCAQHFIGDVGMLATKVPAGEDVVEGYHIYVGGGYGARQDIGRELYRDVPATQLGPTLERMLRGYLEHRTDEEEAFQDFVKRHPIDSLRALLDSKVPCGSSEK